MSPFELALQSELSVEGQRFANEWLFKWHGMTYEGGLTDVDRFDGGRIHYSGIKFGHQQRQVFWQAIERYLDQKIHESFKRWDTETRLYPDTVRHASIEGTERILERFANKIISLSVDTDRRLRGDPSPDRVENYDTSRAIARSSYAIKRLAEAHRTLVDEKIKKSGQATLSRKQRVENFLSDHRGIMGAIGLLLAAAGLIKYFMK